MRSPSVHRLASTDDTYELDGRILAAGQMVLAAMCTPVVHNGKPSVGATLDGRKHVAITMGKRGVLWLSCPPLPASDAIAEGEVSRQSLLLPAPPVSSCGAGMLHRPWTRGT